MMQPATGRFVCAARDRALLGLLVLAFGFGARVCSAAPRIASVWAEPGGAVPLYSKLEVGFQILDSTATMPQWPFDPAPPSGVPAGVGITVNAIFVDPDGREFLQPAFRAEEFVSEVREGRDWHLATGIFQWKVRFSPNQVGNWTYRLMATDSSGTSESARFAFSVGPSGRRGFVRTSPHDTRYFEFDDGTLFTGMGFQLPSYLGSPDTQGGPEYARLASAGVNFARVAISSIFGSAWTTWIGGRNQYRGYLPVTGLLPYHDEATGKTSLVMLLAYGSSGDKGWFDACRLQLWWEDEAESIKPRTTYRIKVEYRGVAITGPRTAASSRYGLVAKLVEGGGGHADCDESGPATPVTSYGGSTNGFEHIEGTWHSGTRHFLPRMQLGLENVRQGQAFVRSISLREDLGDGRLGPEMMIRPSMEHQLYIPEEKAHSLDRIVEHAERHGVYLKLVVMDKDDKIYLKIADDGGWTVDSDDNIDGFYGVGRAVNKTRWLQRMWWRYLQARWGYSPSVHSWELTNEGNPTLVGHYELADEFGKFMRCRVFGVEPGLGDGAPCSFRHPNAHLVTTSFWQWFPAPEFWANPKYPNVDYADLHAYVSTSSAPRVDREAMQWDAAYYHVWHSSAVAAARVGKPVVRGEGGLDSLDEQSETVLGLERDLTGLWFHNFLWASLDSGGLYELYWWNSHITGDSFDHRGTYKGVQAFLSDIPLNRGGYVDWGGTVSSGQLRVVGQKHATGDAMHLWVQNRAHTWKNVVDGVEVAPVSGEIVVSGFSAGGQYTLERWDTFTPGGRLVSIEQVAGDATGNLRIVIDALQNDVALKVRAVDPAGTKGRREKTCDVSHSR